MARRCALALSLLALAVPGLALGGEEPAGEPALSVSASLGACGLASSAIVCEISTSWNALDGAEYYTVSVTRADGSVTDFGSSSGAGRTLYVQYAGPGSYTVQVEAWGTPPGEPGAEPLTSEEAVSTSTSERPAAGRGSTVAPAPKPGDGEGEKLPHETKVVSADGRSPESIDPSGPACEPLQDPQLEDPEAPRTSDKPACP